MAAVIVLGPGFQRSVAAQDESAAKNACAPVLVANFDADRSSTQTRSDAMSLVTRMNFEEVKKRGGFSGGISLLKILGLTLDSSWEEFLQKRNEFRDSSHVSVDSSRANDLVRQIVPDAARRLFVECMMGQAGVVATFSGDAGGGTMLHVSYLGGLTGTRIIPRIQITGGTTPTRFLGFWQRNVTNLEDPLFSGGHNDYFIKRMSSDADVIVTINFEGKTSAQVVSFAPAKLPQALPAPVVAPAESPHDMAPEIVRVITTPEGSRTATSPNAGRWTAYSGPPAWIQFFYKTPFVLHQIRATIDQSPSPSPTYHIVLATLQDGLNVLVTEFDGITSDHGVLEYTPPTPLKNVVSVKLLSVRSPSWISWYAIQVMGTHQ